MSDTPDLPATEPEPSSSFLITMMVLQATMLSVVFILAMVVIMLD